MAKWEVWFAFWSVEGWQDKLGKNTIVWMTTNQQLTRVLNNTQYYNIPGTVTIL